MNDLHDIPTFTVESKTDQKSDDACPYPGDDFIEEDYDQHDRIFGAEQEQHQDLYFSKITVEALMLAQVHDAF